MQKTKVCPKCKSEKSVTEFWVRRSRKGEQPASRCKICSNDANREWRARNPDHEKKRYQRQKLETRERHLVRKYGVSLSDYDEMLVQQNGQCFICGKNESAEVHSVLHVDHCHETGNVRGLLCRNCNHALGLMKDDPSILRCAADYLNAQPAQIPELIGRAILEAESR